MPNILAGKLVTPELIQTEAAPFRILRELTAMLKKDKLLCTSAELVKLRNLFGQKNAEANVVSEIEKLLAVSAGGI
ncbi:MAG: hypothetical protein COZ15_03435 [Elusimicrobia bacterium CG_4_10_14_3_um_filter_49_12_50_7]|nr:MAG: hypothetical protein COZ15_03435 [Elusimicrobia bacterium CG_4_10_14_3_um_filter_49_12_50_7]